MLRKNIVKLKTVSQWVPTGLFLFYIGTMLVLTYIGDGKATMIKDMIAHTDHTVDGFRELAENFEGVLQENIYGRYSYINMNGQIAKMLRINNLNAIEKLENGYLTFGFEEIDVSDSANNLIALNDFLKKRNIDFLYALIPSKISMYDSKAAPGYIDDGWKNIDNMVEAVTFKDVNTIDMDVWYAENGYCMEDVFLKTDHHWKSEGAFAATHVILKYMEENFGIQYDNSMENYDAWNIDHYDQWYLGAAGKRVGTKYAGVDDFNLIYRADQEVDFSYLSRGTWAYRNNVLNMSALNLSSYFDACAYDGYIGGDYALAIIKNRQALNDKKILVVGDSFRLPVETFLSGYFKELHHIDMRAYTDGTLVEYINEIKPDIVLACAYINTVGSEIYSNFGIQEYEEAFDETKEETPQLVMLYTDQSGNICMEAQVNSNQFMVLCVNLEPNQFYTITVDSTILKGGTDKYIQMTLFDLSTNTPVYNRYFDANSYEKQRWIFSTPDDVNAQYAIYCYDGTNGRTENVSTMVENVKLYKGIWE